MDQRTVDELVRIQEELRLATRNYLVTTRGRPTGSEEYEEAESQAWGRLAELAKRRERLLATAT